MSAILDAAYPAARALGVLIDRENILNDIRLAISDQSRSTQVFYLTAPGGIGKTCLLREVLRRCQPDGEWFAPNVLAATEEIDLYHSENHSVEGMTSALYDVLSAAAEYFVDYRTQRRLLQQSMYDLHDALSDLDRRRELLASKFLDNLKALTKDKRVIIALDTAEKLQYESDRIQQLLNLEEEGIDVRVWLINTLLCQLDNVVVLIAGRPHPERLRDDLLRQLGTKLKEMDLNNFAEEDTLAYFMAVEQAAEPGVAERLKAISRDTRRVIHLYTGGRPILLALTIDYLIASDHLLPEVLVSWHEASDKSSEELAAIRGKLEADIVRRIQNLDRVADEVIRTLAWTRKGITPELLSRISGLSLAEAQAGLNKVKEMSFVKIHRGDGRVFLHDEMYDLLQRHVLDRLPEARAEEVYETIEEYYAEQITAARKKVDLLERAGRGQITLERQLVWTPRLSMPAEPDELAHAQLQLERLLVEDVHYQLRHDPLLGFEAYRNYGPSNEFEAASVDFGIKLRDELLAFVNDPSRKEVNHFDGLRRIEVELQSGLQWITRDLIRGRSDSALSLIKRIRDECKDLVSQGGRQAVAELDILEGWALVNLAQDFLHAETLLRDAIRMLIETKAQRPKVLVARAHHMLGYIYRSHGRFRKAIDEYLEATRLWRELGPSYKDGLANTLNNLAWARTEAGEIDQALADCRDALSLRQSLGYRHAIALTYNTMGMIQTRANKAHEGRVNCEHALYMFRELGMPRGIGLASTAIAEATRRMGTGEPELYYPEQIIDLLRQARNFAADAVDIFGADYREPSRLIEALRELGCIYRDWAWLRPQDPRSINNEPVAEDHNPDRGTLMKLGKDAFTHAAELAREKELPYLEIDVMVNLAWLYFYVDDIAGTHEALRVAKSIAPAEYHYSKTRPLKRLQNATGWFWVQLGKAHVLEGNVVMRGFLDNKANKSLLRQAGQHYTLALAYDDLYGSTFRDRKRAEDEIHRQLKGLNIRELTVLKTSVEKTAQDFHLKSPVSMLGFLRRSFGIELASKTSSKTRR